MLIRVSSTLALVVSLLASDIFSAAHGQHGPFHSTELTVTNSVYVTVCWPSGEKFGATQRTLTASETVWLKSTSTAQAAAPSTQAAAALTSTRSSSGTSGNSSNTGACKKRGLAYKDATLTQLFIGSDSKVSWAYNWGQNTPVLASGLEYVPMLWNNHPSLTAPWEMAASKAIGSGSSHLFSFNEPDISGQANMNVNIAARAYVKYIEPFAGKAKLGAPAVTNGGGSMGLTYLSNFISNCSGCTIDFVNIHWYDSATNIAYFKSHVEHAYVAGGNRPVWITEFAATGTNDEQNAFLEAVIPWLDTQPYVERYAYFMCSEGVLVNSKGPSTLGTTFMSL